MIWNSLYLETMPSPARLQDALARAFLVPSALVGVVDDPNRDTGDVAVRAVLYRETGDFRCRLEIAGDSSLTAVESLRGTSAICRQLGIRAFVGAENRDNPWAGFIVDASGLATSAELDMDAEERGEIRLLSRLR